MRWPLRFYLAVAIKLRPIAAKRLDMNTTCTLKSMIAAALFVAALRPPQLA